MASISNSAFHVGITRDTYKTHDTFATLKRKKKVKNKEGKH